MDAPAVRIVATSRNDAGQDDNFRLAAVRHGANATDPRHAGLSAGVKIKADCSINWVDPDFGRRYCFSTATSLVVFLDVPRAYLARARKNWDRISMSANR